MRSKHLTAHACETSDSSCVRNILILNTSMALCLPCLQNVDTDYENSPLLIKIPNCSSTQVGSRDSGLIKCAYGAPCTVPYAYQGYVMYIHTHVHTYVQFMHTVRYAYQGLCHVVMYVHTHVHTYVRFDKHIPTQRKYTPSTEAKPRPCQACRGCRAVCTHMTPR